MGSELSRSGNRNACSVHTSCPPFLFFFFFFFEVWQIITLLPNVSSYFSLNNYLSSAQVKDQRRHPTPVLLPGKSHGRRSPVGCSPWGCLESDRTERLHFHFSPSCIGEGNGNPLQYSCLENPRDSGAWWAAVYGVAQSRTRLKRLSSSSSKSKTNINHFKIHNISPGQDQSKQVLFTTFREQTASPTGT